MLKVTASASRFVGVHCDDGIWDDVEYNSGSAIVYSGQDGSLLYRFDGEAGDALDYSVSGLGDLNGDGLSDFAIGAANGGAKDTGYVRVDVSRLEPSEIYHQ